MNPGKICLYILFLCVGLPIAAGDYPQTEDQLSRMNESRLMEMAQEFITTPIEAKRIQFPGDFTLTLPVLLNHILVGFNVHQYSRVALVRTILNYISDIEKVRTESDMRVIFRFVADVMVVGNNMLVDHFSLFMKNSRIPARLRTQALIEVWQAAAVNHNRMPRSHSRERMRQLEIIKNIFLDAEGVGREDQIAIKRSCSDLLGGNRR